MFTPMNVQELTEEEKITPMRSQMSSSLTRSFSHPILTPFMFLVFLGAPLWLFTPQWEPWWSVLRFGWMILWLGYVATLAIGASRGSIRRWFNDMPASHRRMILFGICGMTIFAAAGGFSATGAVLVGTTGTALVVGTGELIGVSVGILVAIGLIVLLLYRVEQVIRGRNRLCANCGYDRKGDLWTPCPECGYAAEESVENAA